MLFNLNILLLGPNFPIVPYYGGYGGSGYYGGGYYNAPGSSLAAPSRKRRPGSNRFKGKPSSGGNRFNLFRPL